MITVRLPEDVYRVIRQQQGADTLAPERALQRGLRSCLDHPRKVGLLMDGTLEQRLDDLLLVLAQTRASCGVLRVRQASEEKDHTSSRKE